MQQIGNERIRTRNEEARSLAWTVCTIPRVGGLDLNRVRHPRVEPKHVLERFGHFHVAQVKCGTDARHVVGYNVMDEGP
jgi:hypothetical protein